jgi:hypothetical protein
MTTDDYVWPPEISSDGGFEIASEISFTEEK